MSPRVRVVLFIAILVSGLFAPAHVAASGDPPQCDPGNATTTEDHALAGDLANPVLCTDPENDLLTYTVVNGPAHGSVSLDPGGTFTYAPGANFNGSDSFTFVADDGSLPSPPATFSITVTGVNDAPVCPGDSTTGNEDSPVMGSVTCADVDGDPLTYSTVNSPTHGSVLVDPGGSFIYAPHTNFNGTDTFTYLANDGQADSNAATVSITVAPVNDAPACVAEAQSGNEDTVLGGGVSCTDVDGDPLTYAVVTDGSHGSAVFGSDASYTYTPIANFNGSDSFTFQANDGLVDSNTATATIMVAAVNDPPVCAAGSTTTPEDIAAVVSLTCTDVDGAPPTVFALDGLPSHGTAILGLGGSVTYTPTANFNGTDTFTFTAADAQSVSDPATFTITVSPVNDPPVCPAQTIDVRKDTPRSDAVACTDVDGDPLQYTALGNPSNAQVFTLQSNGAVDYTPKGGFVGFDPFSIQASDGTDAVVGTVRFEVRPDPYARLDTPPAIAQGSGPTPIDVLANDVDLDPGDTITITSIINPPDHGKVAITGGGTGVTYDPAGYYAGPDNFQYEITDLFGRKSRAFVILTVARARPRVSPPTASFLTGGTLGTSTAPIRLRWSLVDDGLGVRRYTLQERRSSGPYRAVRLAGPTSRSVTRSVAVGSKWTHRSRLTDRAGNAGAWAVGPSFRVARYQESSVTYGGSWRSSSSSSYSGGRVRYASTAGASATFAFIGSAIGYVAPRSASRGSVRVYVDGVYAGTVSLRSASKHSRSIVFSRSFGSVGNHVIRLEVVGTAGHPRVDLDAFVVIR